MGRTGPHNGLSGRMLEKIFLSRNIDIEYKLHLGILNSLVKLLVSLHKETALNNVNLSPSLFR